MNDWLLSHRRNKWASTKDYLVLSTLIIKHNSSVSASVLVLAIFSSFYYHYLLVWFLLLDVDIFVIYMASTKNWPLLKQIATILVCMKNRRTTYDRNFYDSKIVQLFPFLSSSNHHYGLLYSISMKEISSFHRVTFQPYLNLH